jgi:hypothetical protein
VIREWDSKPSPWTTEKRSCRATIPQNHPGDVRAAVAEGLVMSDRKDLASALAELRFMGLICGARCRDGHACRAKAAWDGIEPYNGRCRIHGGLSTGPRTPEGRERLSAATKKMWAEHREERRARISAGVRRYWERVRLHRAIE